MWLVKFVFFKRRRENKGPLPVCCDDLRAFLGVTQDFNVFSNGFSNALFKSGRNSSSALCNFTFSPQGIVSVLFVLCFILPPS